MTTRNEALTHMANLLVMRLGIQNTRGRHVRAQCAAIDYALELMARELDGLNGDDENGNEAESPA